MNFLHPSFLWALFFLAIPIIVHLFNFRKYKQVFFPNTAILKTILSRTQKTSELKKRLLLLSRLLTFLFVILCFAQPFFNQINSTNDGLAIISIYIDNSQSMEAPSSEMRAIDEAKKKAIEIVSATENQAQYQIITNDFKGSELQLVNHLDALALIKSIDISSSRKNTNQIWDKQLKTTTTIPSSQKYFYWISDFQKNQVYPITSSEFSLTAIPIVHKEAKNIYIDTAFIHSNFIKLNKETNLVYKLVKSNNGESINSMLTLYINNLKIVRKQIDWKKSDTIIDSFKIKLVNAKWQEFKLSISDQNIAFDNDYYLTFYISEKPFVSWMGNSNDQNYFFNALRADENFDVHLISSLKISDLENQNSKLLIINQQSKLSQQNIIDQWLKANKNILITLSTNLDIALFNQNYNSLGIPPIIQMNNTLTRINQINIQDKLLSDVFLNLDSKTNFPNFQSHYIFQSHGSRAKFSLINFENGLPFLVKYVKPGEGSVYVFTAPISPSTSDFVYSSMFAPIIYKLASTSNESNSSSYDISSQSIINIPIQNTNQDIVYSLKGAGDKFIPPQRKFGNSLTFSLINEIKSSGFYSVIDDKNRFVYKLALNYNRGESMMTFLSKSELSKVLNYTSLTIENSIDSYKLLAKNFSSLNLWKLWLFFALFFLGIEMILVLYWDKLVALYNK